MNRNAKRKAMRNRRNVLLVVALMLVVCIASIGGTIAWLTDQSETVTNTFSPSNIDIWMTETVDGKEESTKNGEVIENDAFKMIPGGSESKDPHVVVEANSEDAWLFLQVKENGGTVTVSDETKSFDHFVSYQVDLNNWTALEADGVTGIYYCKYQSRDFDVTVKVLDGETVSYPNTITKEMMDALEKAGEDQYPSLTFKAAAIQTANIADVNAAWNEVKGFFGYTDSNP